MGTRRADTGRQVVCAVVPCNDNITGVEIAIVITARIYDSYMLKPSTHASTTVVVATAVTSTCVIF